MKFEVYCDEANRDVPVIAAQKKQRPLIRYAGSAAETSIGLKPIGSKLSEGAYLEWPVCQASLALARLRAYLQGLGQMAAPRGGDVSVTACSKRVFDYALTWSMNQIRPPKSLSKGAIGVLSDKVSPIGNSRVMANGRYARESQINQRVISSNTGSTRSIDTQQNPRR